MRYLALDIGERRVGLATGDTNVGIAFPAETLRFGTGGIRMEVLLEACKKHSPQALLVGLPLNADGEDTPQCRTIRLVAERLQELMGLPVVFRNEALTTTKADTMLREAGAKAKRRKAAADSIAAVVLLQEFLEEQRNAT